jgi:hypothetical protein
VVGLVAKKIKIDRDKLKKKLDGRDFLWLHRKVVEFGVDVKYTTLLSNIRNEVEWKTIYSYSICKVLNVKFEELFDFE